MTVELMMEKASLQRMKYRVVLYRCHTLAEMRLASLLCITVAEGPQTSLLDIKRGGEGDMFYFQNSPLILSALLLLMSSVASCRCFPTV